MALRSPLEAHFKLFWALVAKLLSDGLWRLILSYSWLWWPNGSQVASGGSFWALLGSGGQMALTDCTPWNAFGNPRNALESWESLGK